MLSMEPYYQAELATIYLGDCQEVAKSLPPLSAVVTDPPYGLGFMGKQWDRGVPSQAMWEAIAHCLLPGAHVLSFGGTRTYHRMACAIEDAGLEIRDCIAWLYGSGMPKSLDVGKAIDKSLGAEREVIGRDRKMRKASTPASGSIGLAWQEDPVYTAPASDLAKQWDGFGTGLKPSMEPIVLARKPFKGPVYRNVLTYGTGAINIKATRVEHVSKEDFAKHNAGVEAVRSRGGQMADSWKNSSDLSGANPACTLGRWPANVIHDGSAEVLELFSRAKGMSGGGKHRAAYAGGLFGSIDSVQTARCDDGSAARFFYCAKASKKEKGSYNTHPTVKPLALMSYLLKLVVPPGGIVLDPFMGSGSTLVAASLLGMRSIGIELDEESCEIAIDRLREVGQVESELRCG